MGVSTSELSIYRGERKVWQVSVTDAAGAAVNLTGAGIYFAVRTAIPAGDVVDDTGAAIAKAVGTGITVTDAAGGVFKIALEGADTNALDPGADGLRLHYGLELVEIGETEPVVLARGILVVLADIVRAA